MKAFQLKIAIKNLKPPVWRRVIVPSGITFSQLGLLLDHVMGRIGEHRFEFEFYHQKLRMAEDTDAVENKKGPWEYMEASETQVNDYLEKNEWFSYTYNAGSSRTHRVTVEEILDNYEFGYPRLIKYKGECPAETDAEEKKSPAKYDEKVVNGELERKFFYIRGNGETRPQREILRNFSMGIFGLHADWRDMDGEQTENGSKRSAGMSGEGIYWKERTGRLTLEDIFNDYGKERIYDRAREKGVKGISGCSKRQLIRMLVDHLMQPHVMEPYFWCLQDEQIEEFEKAADADGFYDPKDWRILSRLHRAGYMGRLSDNRILIPREVSEMYRSFANEEFHEKRKRISLLLTCLELSGVLHGVAPVEIILKMVNQHPDVNMTEEELKALADCIPADVADFVLAEDKVWRIGYYPDDGGLLKRQGNKGYYIPSAAEIKSFGLREELPDREAEKQFALYLEAEFDTTEPEAEFAAGAVQTAIREGCVMEDAAELLEDLGFLMENGRELKKTVKSLKVLWNETRMLGNRGFTPNEIHQMERTKIVPITGTPGNAGGIPGERRGKIYPNDPCPCGSGKKYKNCCRNK